MTNLAISREDRTSLPVKVSELVVVASQQPSVGQRLRLAREAKTWSEGQVARRLNLSEAYIRAIEADAFERLPRRTFVRGYLRNYAICLGLSPHELLKVYEEQIQHLEETQGVPKRPRLKAASTDPLMRILGVLSVVLFVLFSTFWWWRQDRNVPAVTASLAVVEVGTLAGEAPDETLDLRIPQQMALTGSELSAESAFGPVSSGSQSLLVTFTDSSWLEVQDANGAVLFRGVKQAGELLHLTSLSLFDITIGNAAAVKLSYNSAPVDLKPYLDEGNAVQLKLGL